MKDQRPEILYSDQVKEIMGNPPPRNFAMGYSCAVYCIPDINSFFLADKIS